MMGCVKKYVSRIIFSSFVLFLVRCAAVSLKTAAIMPTLLNVCVSLVTTVLQCCRCSDTLVSKSK